MVLFTYAETGETDVAFGEATTLSRESAKRTETLKLVKKISTDDNVPGKLEVNVPIPISKTTVEFEDTKQEKATVPLLGVEPTLALQEKPGMKLLPLTVTVLPTYADVGDTAVAVGGSTIRSGVPLTVALAPLLAKVNSTDDAALGVFAPTTITTVMTLVTLQDVARVPELA